MVLVRDISFAALSEATLLPFHGRCHVAYVPAGGVILGLSKLARAARCLAARLTRQERLGEDLMAAVQAHVGCKGVAVVIQGVHLGAGAGGAPAAATTVAACGCFQGGSGGGGGGGAELEEMLCLLGLPPHAAAATAAAPPRSSGGAAAGGPAAPGAALAAAAAAAVEALLRGVGEDATRPGLEGSAQRYASWLAGATAGYALRPPPPPAAAAGPATPGDRSPADASDASSCDGMCCAERADGGAAGAVEAAAAAHDAQLRHGDEDEAGAAAAGCLTAPGGGGGGGVQTFVCRFVSQCEHHLLPFYGTLKVAYAWGGGGGGAAAAAAALAHIVAVFSRRLQVQERLTQQVADAAAAALGAADLLVVCESAHMCMVARGVEEHASATVTTAARGGWAGAGAGRAGAL
jgi:GTP cyclohydrolase I